MRFCRLETMLIKLISLLFLLFVQVSAIADTVVIVGFGGSTVVPAWVGEIDRGYVTTSTDTDITLSSGVTQGHTVVVATTSVGTVISAVEDDRGNTYTVHVAYDGNTDLSIATAYVSTALQSSDVITITWTNSTYTGKTFFVGDISGAGSTSQPDQSCTSNDYGTSVSCAASTSSANTTLFGVVAGADVTKTYGSSSWTVVGSAHNNTLQGKRAYYVYLDASSAGSKNPGGEWSATINNTTAWVALD